MRGRGGTDIGIKLLPVMWCFSAFQDISTVYEVQQWYKHTALCYISELVSLCIFYNPYHLLVNISELHHRVR